MRLGTRSEAGKEANRAMWHKQSSKSRNASSNDGYLKNKVSLVPWKDNEGCQKLAKREAHGSTQRVLETFLIFVGSRHFHRIHHDRSNEVKRATVL